MQQVRSTAHTTTLPSHKAHDKATRARVQIPLEDLTWAMCLLFAVPEIDRGHLSLILGQQNPRKRSGPPSSRDCPLLERTGWCLELETWTEPDRGKTAAIKSSDSKWLLQSEVCVCQVAVTDAVQNSWDTFICWRFGRILFVDVSNKPLLGDVEIWKVKGNNFTEEVWIQKWEWSHYCSSSGCPLSLSLSGISCDLVNHKKNSSYYSCVKKF